MLPDQVLWSTLYKSFLLLSISGRWEVSKVQTFGSIDPPWMKCCLLIWEQDVQFELNPWQRMKLNRSYIGTSQQNRNSVFVYLYYVALFSIINVVGRESWMYIYNGFAFMWVWCHFAKVNQCSSKMLSNSSCNSGLPSTWSWQRCVGVHKLLLYTKPEHGGGLYFNKN